MKIFSLFLSLCFSLFLLACQENKNPAVVSAIDSLPKAALPNDASLPGNFSDQKILHFDSNAVTAFVNRYDSFKPLLADIRQFYGARQYAYAWFDQKGLVEQADNLYNQVMNLEQEGLPQRIPYRDSLTMIYERAGSDRTAENELMLTAQYFNYATKVWGGLPEKQTRALNWFLPRKAIDLPRLLDSLFRDSTFIGNGYAFRQYNLLKNFLRRYRAIDSTHELVSLDPGATSFKPGDSSKTITVIRKKLFVLGDLPANSGSTVFDDDLRSGVMSFQKRMGIKPDGLLGNNTLKKINTPIDDYITRIIVNMERTRWVPESISGNYFIINIPAFELFAFNHDSLDFTMDVVVGKAVHKTVIFNGDLKYVVFSPYWNVPPDIMKNEILPGIRRDPNYLAKHNMEWNGKSVRQKPGAANSLGQVKFLFPNVYNIYLHDSPQKSLFSQEKRAFSHGCIRLSQPKKMAEYLLRDQPQWTDQKITAAMNGKKEVWVTLKYPVQVYIAYLTAWIGIDGKLNFRDDIYQRDQQLASMIFREDK